MLKINGFILLNCSILTDLGNTLKVVVYSQF